VGEKVGFALDQPTADKVGGADIDQIDSFIAGKLGNLQDVYVREFSPAIYTFDPNGGVNRGEGEDGVTVGYISVNAIPSEVTLEGLYNTMDGALSRMLTDITRFVGMVAQEKARYAARETEFLAAISDKDTEISRLEGEKAALESARAQEQRELSDRIASLETEKRDLDDQLETLRDEMKEAIATRENTILALKQDVQKLKKRRWDVQNPIGPDGQVLAVTDDQGLAVLNRGKADHLQPGTTFTVYTLGKGAQKIEKGVVTVLDVDSKTARARVLSLLNPMNPIVTGDYFESATYNPEEVLHFHLLGRMRKYGKTDAAARLRELGQVVDEEVGIDTDFLVLGAPENEDESLRDTDAYRRAQELGIRVITEAQLSSFLDY
jgi:NAD-dependent DNA ligase